MRSRVRRSNNPPPKYKTAGGKETNGMGYASEKKKYLAQDPRETLDRAARGEGNPGERDLPGGGRAAAAATSSVGGTKKEGRTESN